MIVKSLFRLQLFILFFLTSFNFLSKSLKVNEMDNLTLKNLPEREGERPKTTNTNPHTQLDQQPVNIQYVEQLKDWAFNLGNIEKRASLISVPGAEAMFMEQEHACEKCNAFMIGNEFAHFHPRPDYSMHLGLTQKDATVFISKGWGEWHPLIKKGFLPPNIIMLYAPRNESELEVSKLILKRSYDYAKGNLTETNN
ncbi:hypothetical protein T190607A01A_10501 [Tenacibaculum sp. 190524A05c]|uniref:Luciferase domain-containing protein n=2 Tax=Tenacibaculum platacis TaxID=3137852 RepID=A0ABM9NSG4_9FLAO